VQDKGLRRLRRERNGSWDGPTLDVGLHNRQERPLSGRWNGGASEFRVRQGKSSIVSGLLVQIGFPLGRIPISSRILCNKRPFVFDYWVVAARESQVSPHD
jgi:hypothetical protein